MSNLQTKTALVTSASKGIGAGIALELAKSGASVIVNYASDKNGAEAVDRRNHPRDRRTMMFQYNYPLSSF